jgi:hypothetical protein
MHYRFVLFALPVLSLAHCNPDTTSTSDGGADGAPVSTCKAATGAGTMHKDTIAADETWTAANGPHVVSFDLKVSKGATLTIEPCAEVRIQKGYSIVVEGNLVALGAATTPIKIGADDASTPWGFMQVFAPGTIKLAYATVSDGGGVGVTNAYGMIEARGDQLMPAQAILKLDHVTVSNSGTYGVSLRAGGALTPDSQALTITKSAKAAMRILPRLASNIPTGTYTGNTEDAIVVETEAYGEVNYDDVTYHDRGVPYRVGADVTLGDFKVGPQHFTLTLEAGVKLAFKKNGVLGAVESASSTGVIVANGTADKPVVLTSSSMSPAAGDWVGVQLGKVVDSGFKLDHVEIRYAGGASQSSGHHCQPNPTVNGEQSKNDDAALAIYHEPSKPYLTNSLIADSAGDAVDNAYTGAYVDAKPTNTFMGVAGCQVTLPLPKTGLCPNMGCP